MSQLSPGGDRLPYSTFTGAGPESTVNALALDPQGNVLAAGEATVQPTPGAYASRVGGCPPVIGFFSVYVPSGHAFVLKFNPDLPRRCFKPSSAAIVLIRNPPGRRYRREYLGRRRTNSSNFPTAAPLPNLGPIGPRTGFLAMLDPAGADLVSSTVTGSVGLIGPGPGGAVYFSETVGPPAKDADVLLARIDAARRFAIDLDSIRPLGIPPRPETPPYFLPFSIAPGQAIRLAGRGIGPVDPVDATSAPAHVLPRLADVQVSFNGIISQLVSVQADEIVCFVPFGLDGALSANVQVTYGGETSNSYTIPVVSQNIDVRGREPGRHGKLPIQSRAHRQRRCHLPDRRGPDVRHRRTAS